MSACLLNLQPGPPRGLCGGLEVGNDQCPVTACRVALSRPNAPNEKQGDRCNPEINSHTATPIPRLMPRLVVLECFLISLSCGRGIACEPVQSPAGQGKRK
jgi:hypothetical protein